jgi:hypothetical protein
MPAFFLSVPACSVTLGGDYNNYISQLPICLNSCHQPVQILAIAMFVTMNICKKVIYSHGYDRIRFKSHMLSSNS